MATDYSPGVTFVVTGGPPQWLPSFIATPSTGALTSSLRPAIRLPEEAASKHVRILEQSNSDKLRVGQEILMLEHLGARRRPSDEAAATGGQRDRISSIMHACLS